MTATTIITAIINRDVKLQFFSCSMTGNLPVSWQSTELPSLHAHPSTAVCMTNGDMLLTILSTNYTNSLCQRWGGVMRDKPPFSFVWGQDSTMWDIVWVSPQGHRSVSVSRHFLLQAPQCPCSVWKRFSRDHCCQGRHTRWELTTWADFQLCLHRILMSTGCKSSHSGFLDVSRSNGGLRISGWIGQLSSLTIFSTSFCQWQPSFGWRFNVGEHWKPLERCRTEGTRKPKLMTWPHETEPLII